MMDRAKLSPDGIGAGSKPAKPLYTSFPVAGGEVRQELGCPCSQLQVTPVFDEGMGRVHKAEAGGHYISFCGCG